MARVVTPTTGSAAMGVGNASSPTCRARHAGGASFVGPNGELVSVGVLEMKATAAGKGEHRFDDLRACVLKPALCRGEIVGVEDHQVRQGVLLARPPVSRPSLNSQWAGP